MEIENGDIVLIKHGSKLGERRTFAQFTQILGRTGREKCVAVIVEDFDDLSILDKDEMLKYGWKWVGDDES
jgi:hypothetical protein